MHDLNLLPETETIRRQSRLLLLTALGLTIASGIWISSTHLSNTQLINDLRNSIAMTEAEITPVPPLTQRVRELQERLNTRDATLTHLTTLPALTAATGETLTNALVTFADDHNPNITLDRISAQRADNNTRLTVTVKGRALGPQPIQDRFQRLNALGLLTTSPTVKQEADGTYTFDGNLNLPIHPDTARTP